MIDITSFLIKKYNTRTDLESTRPPEVAAISQACFDAISAMPAGSSGYAFKGNCNYSFFDEFINVQTTVKELKKTWSTSFRRMNVLDIGTGNGELLLNLPAGVKGFGVSAHDFRRAKALSDYQYRLGNAEDLTRIYPDQRFDLIVSHLAFRHFTDPLEALKQAYHVLKPGGILIVDGFHFHGIDVNEWIKILRENGYDAVATSLPDPATQLLSCINFLAIRKTKSQFDDHVIYADRPIMIDELNRSRAVYCFKDRPVKKLDLIFPSKFGDYLRKGIRAFEMDEAEGVFLSADSEMILQMKIVLNDEKNRYEDMVQNTRSKLTEWGVPLADPISPQPAAQSWDVSRYLSMSVFATSAACAAIVLVSGVIAATLVHR